MLNREKAARVLVLSLALLLLVALPGCGMFSTKMARAIQKMSKLDSLHLELSAELTLDVLGQDKTDVMQLHGDWHGGGELFTDPLLLRLSSTLQLPGGETSWENYVKADNGVYYLYSRMNDGAAWQKRGLKLNSSFRVSGLKTIVRAAESFAEAGVEDIGGVSAQRYDGVLSGAYLEELLALYRVQSLLAEELGYQLEDGLFMQLRDVPVSVWLDADTGMIVRAEADLSAFADDLAEKQLRRTMDAIDLGRFGLELRLTGLVLHVQMSRFDAAERFEIPAEADAAWNQTKRPWET